MGSRHRTSRNDIEQLIERNVAELQRMLSDLRQETDDLDLWTYLEDLQNVIPTNLENEAEVLYDGLYDTDRHPG